MKKTIRKYVCQNCGALHPRWSGRCDACETWNSVIEETTEPNIGSSKHNLRSSGSKIDLASLSGNLEWVSRNTSKIQEFDRVLGGGLVPGSAVIIGGDPGIGKSTLLLQVLSNLSDEIDCIYITGEESIDQVRMRAIRIGVETAPISIASATNVSDIIATLDIGDTRKAVVIDSIQTIYTDTLGSAPGTVAQVRTTAQQLINVAKKRGITLLFVGHVTKDGTIAGPRVLEHMVDTVLYFEGERGHQFRILRSVKNRFGATDEIGVFEMTSDGLIEIDNPSALFLGERREDVSGACVFGGMEGSRPLLVEIQALVAPSIFGTPRRAVIGWDAGRLAMVTAVLETRCDISFSGSDVFLNVAGGMKISEPAADLAVAMALLSSLFGKPAPKKCIIFGEIGLSAEVRVVSHLEARVKEAAKLGFEKAFCPSTGTTKNTMAFDTDLQINHISNLQQLVDMFSQHNSEFTKSFSQEVQ